MRLLIAVAALLLLSLTGPVPASAATPSLPSVDNDRPAPRGVQHHTHGETLTSQHHNNHDSVHNTSQKNKKKFPCPLPEDITPCTCFVDEELRIWLECSAVESDEQLASVFNAHFLVNELYAFVIDQNDNIAHLGFILNGVTFQSVQLTYISQLELVSDEFLLDSTGTLESLTITHSALTRASFPFLTLSLYTQLRSLIMNYSTQLTSIPKLKSDSISYISFTGSAITYIEPGTFDAIPQLQTLVLGSNKISSLQPGTFVLTDSLTELVLQSSEIATIEPGTFVVPENNGSTLQDLNIFISGNLISELKADTFVMTDRPYYLHLSGNSLSSLEAGAFVLPQTTEYFSLLLLLTVNNLTVLEEEVLGELFPYITTLDVYNNPLACGCDVAWLVLNPEYMTKINDGATCADGQVFQELDPGYYEASC